MTAYEKAHKRYQLKVIRHRTGLTVKQNIAEQARSLQTSNIIYTLKKEFKVLDSQRSMKRNSESSFD